VGVTSNTSKKALFSIEERMSFIKMTIADTSGVEVRQFHGLLVDFAREMKASLVIRGLRAVSDFEYEFQMALMNRHMSPNLETVFMVPSLETTYISSSVVREIAQFGGDLKGLVHPKVGEALREKFAGDQKPAK